jgi:hypothetical protein
MSNLLSDAATWIAVLTAILGLGSYFVQKAAEARSTNRAILAEINRLLTVVKEHHAFWERMVKSKTTSHHPLIPFSHVVYSGQVANVGVIHRKLVAEVVEFYGYVDYLNSLQALRGNYDAAGHEEEFNCMYLNSLERLLHDFEKVFENAVKEEGILTAG